MRKNPFVIIGDGILTGVIHAAYFLWGIGDWIIYRPKLVYKDPASKEKMKKPCILIANHTDHHDGSFVPHVFMNRKIYVLVMTKWYNKKGLHTFFSHLRYIPINLYDGDTEWLDKAKKVIESGKSVLIFPEGKLSLDGNLCEFLPGFLMLKKYTDVPVIPLALKGGYKAFHRESVTVGSEITFDVHAKGRPSLILKEGAKVCREQMEELLKES